MDVPPAGLRVGRAFVDAGARIYLVGGTIRDALINRAPAPGGDWDLTTDARPEQILEITEPLATADNLVQVGDKGPFSRFI